MFRTYLYEKLSKRRQVAPLGIPAGKSQGSVSRLERWSLRFQEHDITLSYKSVRKQRDADSLSLALIKPDPAISNDDDEAFLGAVHGAIRKRGAPQRSPHSNGVRSHTEPRWRRFR